MIKSLLLICLFSIQIASAKTEVELKLNLTKKGYDKLKSHLLSNFQNELSERTDYYFEIYKDGQYFLKKAEPPIKLRFQSDDVQDKWQVQKTIKTQTDSIFSIKTTDADTMDVKNHKVFEQIMDYHKALNKLDPYALHLAQKIQEALAEDGILSFTQRLCQSCTQDSQYFSSHTNHKKRVKVKINLSDEDQVVLQVGQTDNRGVLTYELEAEVKKSKNLHTTAELLKNWLLDRGFTTELIETNVSSDPTLPSEMALRKLYQQ